MRQLYINIMHYLLIYIDVNDKRYILYVRLSDMSNTEILSLINANLFREPNDIVEL